MFLRSFSQSRSNLDKFYKIEYDAARKEEKEVFDWFDKAFAGLDIVPILEEPEEEFVHFARRFLTLAPEEIKNPYLKDAEKTIRNLRVMRAAMHEITGNLHAMLLANCPAETQATKDANDSLAD